MDASVSTAPPKPAPVKRRPWYRSRIHTAWLIFFVLPVAIQTAAFAMRDGPESWYSANWGSTGTLPDAANDPEARVLVFAARNGSWRSIFADHSWIVVKPKNGPYTRYEVTGFGQPIRINRIAPDAYWYSNYPTVVGDIRGALAEEAIPKIREAVNGYAFSKYGDYRIWPGPNSNTFVATVLRAVPELEVALPPTAIGKDFRADYSVFGLTPSGTGIELELFGLIGFKAGWVEGIEVNLLTLVAGIDIRNPAIKLPGIGRIDMDRFTALAAGR